MKSEYFLGGRAIRFELYPLSFSEIPNFDILRAFNNGLLPRMYDSKNANVLLEAYIGSYLEDEIIAETKIRNAEVFSRFLSKAAFANGEFVNYTNIAQDCGVASSTIKEYYQILEETLIGSFVPSFQKKPKRRVVLSPKFYFFDLGGYVNPDDNQIIGHHFQNLKFHFQKSTVCHRLNYLMRHKDLF